MTLYVIIRREQIKKHQCDVSLEAASRRKGLRYERLVLDDIRLDDIKGMQFEAGSLLYRLALGLKPKTVEALLTTLHPGTFTTMIGNRQVYPQSTQFREMAEQISRGLNIIPTIMLDETWLDMSEKDSIARLQQIGGFPLVVKTLGMSHGKGVVKADDYQQFTQLLKSSGLESCTVIARKYLADYRHYRLIVVDDAVEAVVEYHKPDNDFRTNASTPVVSAVSIADMPAEILQLARDATRLRANLAGGVDILVDKADGVGYLAEVNAPCYFARAEEPTGVDIAGKIIETLQKHQREEAS